MPNKPTKHHFVPECYLKKFTNNGKHYVLDVIKVLQGFNEYPKLFSPGGICYTKNGNDLKFDLKSPLFDFSQYDRSYLESEIFTKLERKYDDLFEELIDHNKNFIEIDSAKQLCDFIVLLKMRNPFFKRNFIDPNSQPLMMEMRKIILEEIAGKFEPSEIRKRITEGVDVEIQKVLQHQDRDDIFHRFELIQRAKSIEKNHIYHQMLIDSIWQVWEAPDNSPGFITSDNPGFALDMTGEVHNSRFKDGFIFMFPLCPKYCLWISDLTIDHCLSLHMPIKRIHRRKVSWLDVMGINSMATMRINKLLVSDKQDYLESIIKNKKMKKEDSI